MGSSGGAAYEWIGNTSRDQYIGVFFGLGIAYDMIGDAATRARVSVLVTRLLSALLNHGWSVVMPDLSVSTTFLVRPDQQLSLLQIGQHVSSAAFSGNYAALTTLAPSVAIPIQVDTNDVHGSYFKFNLDYDTFYHLKGLETSGALNFFYATA
jgi:hypothetical protein